MTRSRIITINAEPPPEEKLEEEAPRTSAEPPIDMTVDIKELSIDSIMQKGLIALERAMRCILKDITGGRPSRTSIANLKDCMSMLHDLKKEEREILDKMDDEELAAAANKSK